MWKTMPIPIMQTEAATPPIEHSLSHLCKLAAIRLHKLEPSHPLRRRTKKAWTSTRPTRLEQVAKQCPQQTEYSNPMMIPASGENHLFGGPDKCLAAAGYNTNKNKAKENVTGWLNSRNRNELIVYTDGSQQVDFSGKTLGTGSAWVVWWKNQWLGNNGFALGKNVDVYDAEAWALCGGLEAAVTCPMSSAASAIHLCLDNLSLAQAAGSVPNGSSQNAFKRFRDIAKNWRDKGKNITVQWIPGHTGLKGNEIADREAKKFAGYPPSPLAEKAHTLSHARKSARAEKDNAWAKEWDNQAPRGAIKIYQDLCLKPSSNVKDRPELKLKREILGWLIATRSGHGHFADYHERFGHEEAELHCKCGQRRARLHPFLCPTARPLRAKLFSIDKKRPLTPSEILGTPEGVRLFASWAPETKLFSRNKSSGEESVM